MSAGRMACLGLLGVLSGCGGEQLLTLQVPTVQLGDCDRARVEVWLGVGKNNQRCQLRLNDKLQPEGDCPDLKRRSRLLVRLSYRYDGEEFAHCAVNAEPDAGTLRLALQYRCADGASACPPADRWINQRCAAD